MGSSPNPDPITITDPNLPQELQGKTPAEIAEYYRNREAEWQARLDAATAVNVNTPAPIAEPTASELWNNPIPSIRKLAPSREEFNAAVNSAQQSMISVARIVAKENKADWNKWESEVMRIMNALPSHLQADPYQWKTAYTYVKGLAYDSAVKDASALATARGGETPSLPPNEPAKPQVLTEEQRYVTERMGLTSEDYFSAQKNLANNSLPITFDTRRKRK